jgi:hypothetical protein
MSKCISALALAALIAFSAAVPLAAPAEAKNRTGRNIAIGAAVGITALAIAGAAANAEPRRYERYEPRVSRQDCRRWARHCDQGSGWACNKYDRHC